MLKMLSIPFSEPDPTTPRVLSSPRSQAKQGGGAAALMSPPLSAQKVLPIRKERFIDPERDNAGRPATPYSPKKPTAAWSIILSLNDMLSTGRRSD